MFGIPLGKEQSLKLGRKHNMIAYLVKVYHTVDDP